MKEKKVTTNKQAKQQKIISSLVFLASLLPAKLNAIEKTAALTWQGYFYLEELTNMSGGFERGSVTNTTGDITAIYDTEMANLWPHGLFKAGVMGIATSRKANNLTGSVQWISNIQATPQLRLSDLYYEHKINDTTITRLGVFDMNDYFNTTNEASDLLNSSFGNYPTLTINAFISTYPYTGFSAMGAVTSDDLTTQIGLFQGDPKHLDTVFKRGHMLIGEVIKQISLSPEHRWTLKGGIWHYQQKEEAVGITTAGIYGLSEIHWQGNQEREFGIFLQAGANHPPAKNTVPYYLGTGFRIKALFPDRIEDRLTLGIASASIRPISKQETVYEIVYAIQLTKQLTLSPDIQYIISPSGIYPNAWAGVIRLYFDPFMQ